MRCVKLCMCECRDGTAINGRLLVRRRMREEWILGFRRDSLNRLSCLGWRVAWGENTDWVQLVKWLPPVQSTQWVQHWWMARRDWTENRCTLMRASRQKDDLLCVCVCVPVGRYKYLSTCLQSAVTVRHSLVLSPPPFLSLQMSCVEQLYKMSEY